SALIGSGRLCRFASFDGFGALAKSPVINLALNEFSSSAMPEVIGIHLQELSVPLVLVVTRCRSWLGVMIFTDHLPHLPAPQAVADDDEIAGSHRETEVIQ